MYVHVDDPLTALLLVLYNLVPVLLPLLPGLIISFLASRTLLRHQMDADSWADDGSGVAAVILERAGVSGWSIVRATSPLATFCDPWRREIRLEGAIFDGRTSWSAGVAAHQAALAVQAWRHPRLAQFRALATLAAKLGCGVAWLCVGSGVLLLTAKISLAGSILYTGLAAVLLGLQRLEASADRSIREGVGHGHDLSTASPEGRALTASSWREVAAALPFDLRRVWLHLPARKRVGL